MDLQKTILIIGTGLVVILNGCGKRADITVSTPTTQSKEIVQVAELEVPLNCAIDNEEPTWTPNVEDVNYLAKTMWGEARGVPSKMEIAAVAWCVLNRVDSEFYPNTIAEVVTAPYQFAGYRESYPVTDELAELATDVLIRWHTEKETGTCEGRVLPPDYFWFSGDGERNYFRNAYRNGTKWDWSLDNPYER